jgi:hypothetical protein
MMTFDSLCMMLMVMMGAWTETVATAVHLMVLEDMGIDLGMMKELLGVTSGCSLCYSKAI